MTFHIIRESFFGFEASSVRFSSQKTFDALSFRLLSASIIHLYSVFLFILLPFFSLFVSRLSLSFSTPLRGASFTISRRSTPLISCFITFWHSEISPIKRGTGINFKASITSFYERFPYHGKGHGSTLDLWQKKGRRFSASFSRLYRSPSLHSHEVA